MAPPYSCPSLSTAPGTFSRSTLLSCSCGLRPPRRRRRVSKRSGRRSESCRPPRWAEVAQWPSPEWMLCSRLTLLTALTLPYLLLHPPSPHPHTHIIHTCLRRIRACCRHRRLFHCVLRRSCRPCFLAFPVLTLRPLWCRRITCNTNISLSLNPVFEFTALQHRRTIVSFFGG